MSIEDSEQFTIEFKMEGRLDRVFFNPHRPEGLAFCAADPSIELTIAPVDPEGDGGGFESGLTCRSSTRVVVSRDLWDFVDALTKRRFKQLDRPAVQLPYVVHGNTWIDAEGVVGEGRRVPFKLYPLELQSLFNQVHAQLRQNIERFVKLVRWNQEIDGPQSVFDFEPAFCWRASPGPYFAFIGDERSFEGRSPAGITWEDRDQTVLRELWARSDLQEPLGHELLREAQASAESSPRSALLTAASALEAGVKAHIQTLLPEAGWLMEEMPSPPVHLMLRKYLPELHRSRGTGLADWSKLKPLFNEAEALAKYRNKLTHTGQMPADACDRLPAFLVIVRDLLYILDFLEGHHWAQENVSHRVRDLLDWPPSTRTRYFVTMSAGPD